MLNFKIINTCTSLILWDLKNHQFFICQWHFCCSSKENIPAIVVLVFCAEGDNAQDAVKLAYNLNLWMDLIDFKVLHSEIYTLKLIYLWCSLSSDFLVCFLLESTTVVKYCGIIWICSAQFVWCSLVALLHKFTSLSKTNFESKLSYRNWKPTHPWNYIPTNEQITHNL